MRNWRGWLLVLAIVAVITTGGVLAQQYLDRSAGQLAIQLERVQQAVGQQDWRSGEDCFDTLKENWDAARRNWALFTDHLELDNLEMRLVRLQEFIEMRDDVNARVEAGEAMSLLRHIPERERLTWRNVF